MLGYERKTLVLLALIQVGVILAGVLCCGLSTGVRSSWGGVVPKFVSFFLNYGVLFLIVPIIWLVLAIHLCEKENTSLFREGFFYFSGGLLAVLPGLYFLRTILTPLCC